MSVLSRRRTEPSVVAGQHVSSRVHNFVHCATAFIALKSVRSAHSSWFKRLFCDFYRTAAGSDSGKQPSLEAQGPVSGPPNCEDSDEPTGRGGKPGRNILSHVATEQRRRDKINEG